MTQKLIVIGAGGHAKVVIATAIAAGFDVIGVFDDDQTKWGRKILGILIEGPVEKSKERSAIKAILGIGDNRVRKKMATELELPWAILKHPSAAIHSSVEISPGCVFFANSVVQPESKIGQHVVVNTGATIDHDCLISSFVHLGPGVSLSGEVVVGEGVLFGVGSCARPQTKVGDWSVIGAGAAVVSEIPQGVTAIGIPARSR